MILVVQWPRDGYLHSKLMGSNTFNYSRLFLISEKHLNHSVTDLCYEQKCAVLLSTNGEWLVFC